MVIVRVSVSGFPQERIGVAPEGPGRCRVEMETPGEVVELAMTDEQLLQLVRAANSHLDKRAEEAMLAMQSAERAARESATAPVGEAVH